MCIIKLLGKSKTRKLKKINMSIDAKYHYGEKGKGADVWGSDWVIPVAEEFEWHFFDDTDSGKQYITTSLTDYIFWFIPFTYDQYVYEVPGGTFKKGELTTKKVAELIYFLEHWNWHCEVYYDDNVNWLQLHSDSYWNNYTMGNNDYSFIRTKCANNQTDNDKNLINDFIDYLNMHVFSLRHDMSDISIAAEKFFHDR